VYCVSLLHQHRRVCQHVVQVAEGVEWVVFRVARAATVMVVKRKTRNEGNTHHKPVVPRVRLLKCAPSSNPLDGWRGATLNVACS
jgi:hypothetical protein